MHRDLKPANVMLTKDGAKLLDFGLAKLKPQRPVAGVGAFALSTQGPATTPGAVVGTVPYMAPEQLEGKEIDERTDLFAFGCVLYEMLTGRRAFAGESEASVISAIMTSEPRPLSSLQPATPPALDRLASGCLAKDPDKRRQSAHDIAEDLRTISLEPSPLTGRPRPRARPRTVSRAEAAFGTALALTAFVAAGIWFWHDRPIPMTVTLKISGNGVLPFCPAQCLAVAADGSGFVYWVSRAGRMQLEWHQVATSESWPLTGTEDASHPFLSPDGRSLGFFRDNKLWKLALASGKVVDGSTPTELATTRLPRGATWAPDGSILFCPRPNAGLWRIASGGGPPTELTHPNVAQNEGSHAFPSMLPGGRAALFTIRHLSGRQDRCSIGVVQLDTGQWWRVREGGAYARYLQSGHIVYARNGVLLAVPFDPKTLRSSGTPVPVVNGVRGSPYGGAMNAEFDVAPDGTIVYVQDPEWAAPPSYSIVWVNRQGELEPVVPERRIFGQPVISPDGRRLAMAIEGPDIHADLHVYDLRERRWQQLTHGSDTMYYVWSPTGDRIAFNSNRDGVFNLYVIRADGEGEADRLTWSQQGQQKPFSWSQTASSRTRIRIPIRRRWATSARGFCASTGTGSRGDGGRRTSTSPRRRSRRMGVGWPIKNSAQTPIPPSMTCG